MFTPIPSTIPVGHDPLGSSDELPARLVLTCLSSSWSPECRGGQPSEGLRCSRLGQRQHFDITNG